MTAYIVIHVEITDPEQYKAYTRLSPAIIKQYGGKFIARNGHKISLEGSEETRRLVILEFPTVEQAKAVREGAAAGHFVAIEGVE